LDISLYKMVARQADVPVWPGPAYVPKVESEKFADPIRIMAYNARDRLLLCRRLTVSTATIKAKPLWSRKGMLLNSQALLLSQSC